MRTNFLRLAIGALVALALSACGGPDESARVAAVSKALEQNFAEAFAKLEFLQHGYQGEPNTSLRYSGASSTVLALSKPKLHEGRHLLQREPYVYMDGLAKTQGGRYFVFSYLSKLETGAVFGSDPCLESECRYFRSYRPISEEHARSWLFYERELFTPELYKQLFGVEAPPREIPA